MAYDWCFVIIFMTLLSLSISRSVRSASRSYQKYIFAHKINKKLFGVIGEKMWLQTLQYFLQKALYHWEWTQYYICNERTV